MAEGHQSGRQPNYDEKNQMRLAIRDGNIQTVENMIKRDGIDVNAVISPDYDGTALHWAVIYNKLHIIKKLVELGADITITTSVNNTPLDYAIGENNTDIINYFIIKCQQDTTKIKQENQQKIQGMEEIRKYLQDKADGPAQSTTTQLTADDSDVHTEGLTPSDVTSPTKTEVATIHKDVYHKFYPQLVSSLPMKDAIFLSHLIKLLPGDLKEKVRTEKTPAEAATCFLDNMIKPAVESGNMEPFDILLLTMETSDNIHLKKLAQSIKQDLEKSKPVNGD